jgi:hypothetical protein
MSSTQIQTEYLLNSCSGGQSHCAGSDSRCSSCPVMVGPPQSPSFHPLMVKLGSIPMCMRESCCGGLSRSMRRHMHLSSTQSTPNQSRSMSDTFVSIILCPCRTAGTSCQHVPASKTWPVEYVVRVIILHICPSGFYPSQRGCLQYHLRT